MNITELRATSLAIFIFLNVVVYQNGRQFSLETSVFWAWIWRYNALTAAATFCSICVAFFYPSSGLVDLIIQMIGTLQFGQLGIVVLLILAIYLRNRISSDKPERMVSLLIAHGS